MPRTPDPLNQLLRQAMFQQRQKVKVQVQKPQFPDPVYDLYAPINWIPSRTLALIHSSPDGRETFLGVFIELRNERAKVRRLIRDHSGTSHGTLPREVVSGPHWLRPKVYEPVEDSEQEIEAIRNRFHELMKEFG